MTTLFKIALRNVFLHWRQSLAATISLAAGLIALVMFQGYMKDVGQLYQETFRSRMMYGDVIVEHQKLTSAEGRAEPWKYAVSPKDFEFLQSFFKTHSEKVDSVSRFLRISGTVANGKSSTIFRGYGYDIVEGEKIRGSEWGWNALYGTPMKADKPHTTVLGQSLGKILNCLPEKKEKVMDAVAGYKAEVRPFTCEQSNIQLSTTTAEGQLNAIDIEVVGLMDALYKDVDDKFLVTSLADAQTLMNTPDVSYVTAKFLKEGRFIDQIVNEFNQEAQKAGSDQRMIRWQDHITGDMYNRTMSLLSVFRNFVVTIIVVIASLSIFNTMMKLVKERTREIGTLRSIGFVPRQILFIFVSEAVVLSFLGGIIGSIVAIVSTFGMNGLGILYKAGVLVEPIAFRIMVSPSLYVISFIFLSILAAVTTWIVCRATLKQSTAENLTYV
ncbi:ABC transporter permease [Bdellovibrio sp. HCB337]|uniref:ABC transporter permease n=1 Tax=Bdellovibrio sp. HCB337 TaxID=3394358 RepID=UPI0039A4E59B